MGSYHNYGVNIRLKHDTPRSITAKLLSLCPRDSDGDFTFVPSEEDKKIPFFRDKRFDDVFSNFGSENCKLTAGTRWDKGFNTLTACANSKAIPSTYELLFEWLRPYIEDETGTVVGFCIPDDFDYYGSEQYIQFVLTDTGIETKYVYCERPKVSIGFGTVPCDKTVLYPYPWEIADWIKPFTK